MEEKKPYQYRSFFWPILLIGVGVIWLLANLEIIPGVNWRILWRFWPLIMVAVGLDIIFSKRTPILGVILGLGTIGLAILLLILAPSLGLTTSTEVITERFSEPIGQAESAHVIIDPSVGPINFYTLSDSSLLVDAEITHIGEIKFVAQGEERKTIELGQKPGMEIISFEWPEKELRWDIGLSPQVPIFLELEGDVGEVTLDLSDIQLTGVDVSVDVGGLDLTLPAMDEIYDVEVNGGVGEVKITILEGTDVNLDLTSDVGDFLIVIPEGAAVKIDARTDVGDIRVPSTFNKVSSGEDDFVGDSGVWETPNYDDAESRITIEFDGDVGDLTVR